MPDFVLLWVNVVESRSRSHRGRPGSFYHGFIMTASRLGHLLSLTFVFGGLTIAHQALCEG